MTTNPRDFLAALRAKKSAHGDGLTPARDERREVTPSPFDADLVTVAVATPDQPGELIPTLAPSARSGQTEPVATIDREAATSTNVPMAATDEGKSAVAVGTAVRVLSISQDAEKAAKRKAYFCDLVFNAATHGVTLEQAAAAVAADNDWSDVTHGGRAIITVQTAWRNYRKWSKQMGRVAGSKKPDVENWRSLVAGYHDPSKFKKNYVRPGSDLFWNGLRKLYENENKPSLRYCYSVASSIARKAGLDDLPTYDQVKHWYTVHADKRAVAIAREGEEFARLNLIGFIEREAPAVDDAWFADHHIFDAAIKVWDEKAGAWKPVRPWLTAWLDWGSLDFTGVLVRAIDPNRDAIERCLKQAITGNGMIPPRHVYVDNGRDFKAAGFARTKEDDDTRFKSVCGLLNIKPIFAIPYNARAKVIERMFGIVCGQFSKLWKSYRGSTPDQRPESADAAWKDVESLPTLEQFDSAFRQWLQTFYRQTKSTGRILDGKSPAEMRAAAKPLRSPVSELDLHKAFLRALPGGARVIHAGGVVRALGRNFQHDALWQLMAKTRMVVLKVDPDDVSRVFAFTEDGREIAELSEVKRVAGLAEDPMQIEALREQLKEKQRRMRELKSLRRLALGRVRGEAAHAVFDLPAGALLPDVRDQKSEVRSEPINPDDIAALAEMEAVVAENTSQTKAARFDEAELTADDRADLAMFNHNP